MSTAASTTLEDYFPFMRLPLELRLQIYKILLVTSCCQPGVPIEHPYSHDYSEFPLRDEIPAFQVLQASKAVNSEATPIFYSCNTISTATLPSYNYFYDTVLFRFPDDFWDSLDIDSLAKDLQSNFLKGLWTRAKEALARDVSMIFDPDSKQRQTWLCLQPAWAWFKKHELRVQPPKTRRRARLNLDLREDLGSHLPTFLCRIGKVNASTIRRVKLQFPDAVRCAMYFPVYAELLRQHVPKLCRLSIDIRNMGCYDESLDWGELYLYYEEKIEQLADDVVVALFDEIRQLFKDLPDLKELAFNTSCDAFDELATAIMEEKRTGKAFDIRNTWGKLMPLRFIIAKCGNPFHSPESGLSSFTKL